MLVYLISFGILGTLAMRSADPIRTELLITSSLSKRHLNVVNQSRWTGSLRTIYSRIHSVVQRAPYFFNPSYCRLGSHDYYHSQKPFFISRSSALQEEGEIPSSPPDYIDVKLGPATTSYRGSGRCPRKLWLSETIYPQSG